MLSDFRSLTAGWECGFEQTGSRFFLGFARWICSQSGGWTRQHTVAFRCWWSMELGGFVEQVHPKPCALPFNVNPRLINPYDVKLGGYHSSIFFCDSWGSTPLINRPWFMNPGLTLLQTFCWFFSLWKMKDLLFRMVDLWNPMRLEWNICRWWNLGPGITEHSTVL